MTRNLLLTEVILLSLIFTSSCTTDNDAFLNLQGPYLGQNPPGMTPEIFAPGIISKTGNHLHSCVSFSPDGKEIYFTFRTDEPVRKNTIYFMRMEGNRWTKSRVAPFSGEYDDDSPAFSQDGKLLFFNSARPIDASDESNDLNFWYVRKTGSEWSEPVYAGDVLNTDSCDFRLSISQQGRFYLSSDRAYQGRRSFDIFVSNFTHGAYSIPRIMDDAITTPATEQIGFIAPDESYIVYYQYSPSTRDSMGLYISFRKENGSWIEGKNMGALFNTPAESCTQAASLSPDGKYLFFLRRYDEAIYWVDANIIEELKPNKLK